MWEEKKEYYDDNDYQYHQLILMKESLTSYLKSTLLAKNLIEEDVKKIVDRIDDLLDDIIYQAKH
jgi:hypothetical protein